MDYDDNMENECIRLCDAINEIPGLKTENSCRGHGVKPFTIYFRADVHLLNNLPILLYYCDACHVGFTWDVLVLTDCAMSPVKFLLKSRSKGEQAYEEANIIAKEIKNFMEGKDGKAL